MLNYQRVYIYIPFYPYCIPTIYIFLLYPYSSSLNRYIHYISKWIGTSHKFNWLDNYSMYMIIVTYVYHRTYIKNVWNHQPDIYIYHYIVPLYLHHISYLHDIPTHDQQVIFWIPWLGHLTRIDSDIKRGAGLGLESWFGVDISCFFLWKTSPSMAIFHGDIQSYNWGRKLMVLTWFWPH